MRSIHGSLVNLQPLIEVSVGRAGYSDCDRLTVTALIDTGATRTCLTPDIIGTLDLEPRAKLLVASATSFPERRRAYGYSLGLFCQSEQAGDNTLYVLPDEFIAPHFQENGNFQVLLGMDVISRGELTLRPDHSFTFRFAF